MRRAAFAAAALAAACAGPPPPPEVVLGDGRYAMGTVLEITVHAPDAAIARKALDALFAEAARLDALFSRHDETSALSRLNRAAGQGPQPVPPELRELLARAVDYERRTGGAFDVKVGPLVALWTEAARRDALPDASELSRARRAVRSGRVRMVVGGRVELEPEGVSVDLGGIAKGYALDRMLPILRAHGIERALLSFGQSSAWAVGAPPGHEGWRLLARGAGDDWLGVLTLRDRALSVSGSLGQWSTIAGERFGHVLDPRSGWPLRRARQALVVAPDATRAEALSKALLVLEADEALALLAREGCEGLLVDASGERVATPGWEAAVRFRPVP